MAQPAVAGAFARGARPGHPRLEPRAAAPGTDRDRREERVVRRIRCGRRTARRREDRTKSAGKRSSCTGSSVAEGVYPVGFSGEGFAFDNEGPRHNVYLAPFRLASRLVTNGEYMEFMRDERLRHGRSCGCRMDGTACAPISGSAPLYWEQRDGEWWHYTMDGMQPVDPERTGVPRQLLRGRRLRSLGRCAAGDRVRVGDRRRRRARVEGNFMETGALSPRSRARKRTTDPDVRRCLGVDERALTSRIPDFNRRLARSANTTASSCAIRWCCAAARARLRSRTCERTYRNFFPPHVRWQFMGIRLANGD